MSECGLTMLLKNENKTSVIQAILFHDAIGRTKTALDQLRDGLSCLGFLEKMNTYPVLFEELFVFKGSSLTSEAEVSLLTFPTSMDNEEKRVDGFLTEFLMDSSQDTLKMFLTFVRVDIKKLANGVHSLQIGPDTVITISGKCSSLNLATDRIARVKIPQFWLKWGNIKNSEKRDSKTAQCALNWRPKCERLICICKRNIYFARLK
ncbi:uncharacterized protein [Acropora muricata]|uniref:uncharacterized protein isoform X2 n=1 Tax=Acropora muricata TaxID=159855 RepID=UPI0034E4BB91